MSPATIAASPRIQGCHEIGDGRELLVFEEAGTS
jgi:hypothetical protein